MLVLDLETILDSESAKVGDHSELHLAQPVIDKAGDSLLPVGWIVPGHVTKVRPAGKSNCRDGSVEWTLDAAKTPDGTKVELSMLLSRPYGPNGLAEKVQLKSAGQKFGEALEIAPLLVVTSPLIIPLGLAMAVGERERCHGKPGTPKQVLAGTTEYAAVAKDVQVSVVRGPVRDAPSPH